jgi:D-beta-D-heptose 7-phosphate kinase/D-beta-D-heptose 1-phosphate adenosyltransferase
MLFEPRPVHILCLGDVMIDRYIYGAVERISPESPVPVLHTHRDFMVIGGAGNVARNIKSLGGSVDLMSVCGHDATGAQLEALCNEAFNGSFLIEEATRKTTLKTRFVAQGQQLLRVDDEVNTPLLQSSCEAIYTHIEKHIERYTMLVLSDYAKGFFTPELIQKLISFAKSHNLPVIADPKGKDFSRYAGATVITPNLKELCDAMGSALTTTEAQVEAARHIQKEHNIEHVLLTLGSGGMLLIEDTKAPQLIEAQAREVYDVSGAGDTVVATLAVALSSGCMLTRSAHLANAAAGIAVGKVGTSTVTRSELEAFTTTHKVNASTKVMDLPTLVEQVKNWRRQGLRVGFTNGCFDLLHQGHLTVLQESAATCDRLIVAVNTDCSVKQLKGPTRPMHDEQTRTAVLAALEMVDAVVLFDDETPFNLIHAVIPDTLIKGGDYTPQTVVGADIVQANGGRVVIVDILAGHSTTSTITRMV